MWPSCRDRRIASITHPPIYNTDLTHLVKDDLDLAVKTSARSSIRRFAWDIRGGDIILVGDSLSKKMIARGYVTSQPGKRAYRYNDRKPITEPSNPRIGWRHEVPVAWDDDFEPFRYKDGAPRITVMHFDPAWAKNIDEHGESTVVSATESHLKRSDPLNESAYTTETRASRRNILRLHAALSNRFRVWLKNNFGALVDQERNRVDLTFCHGGVTHLAELKICYGANTRLAIREALGQLFEYNHYPPRSQAQSWWLVLDQGPAASDFDYIRVIRAAYHLPLTLAWSAGAKFEAFPELPDSLEGLPTQRSALSRSRDSRRASSA